MKSAIALLLLCGFAVFSIKVKNQLNTKTSPLTEVKLNEPMPDFTLPDANGQIVNLSDVCRDNQVVMINFWASWCTPCRMEMPGFEDLYRSNKANGFTILAINVDKDRAKADAYLQSKPVSFPTLFDKKGELLDRFKIESLPTTILVGHDGRVLRVYEGVDPYIQYGVQNDLLQKKHGP
jgi:thiol-disulfide isomerase/thioredoxin